MGHAAIRLERSKSQRLEAPPVFLGLISPEQTIPLRGGS